MNGTHPNNRRLRYASVGSYGRALDAQLAHLLADRCAPVHQGTASDPQPPRRELRRILRAIRAGYVVTVTRIDGLPARPSTFLRLSCRSRCRTPNSGHGRAMGRRRHRHGPFDGDVLSGMADPEQRDLIRACRSRAIARRQHVNRPPCLALPCLDLQQQVETHAGSAEDVTFEEFADS